MFAIPVQGIKLTQRDDLVVEQALASSQKLKLLLQHNLKPDLFNLDK